LKAPAKISPATLAKLAKLGIHHRADLQLHLPLRYEDETHLAPIATVQPGETVQVQVSSCTARSLSARAARWCAGLKAMAASCTCAS